MACTSCLLPLEQHRSGVRYSTPLNQPRESSASGSATVAPGVKTDLNWSAYNSLMGVGQWFANGKGSNLMVKVNGKSNGLLINNHGRMEKDHQQSMENKKTMNIAHCAQKSGHSLGTSSRMGRVDLWKSAYLVHKSIHQVDLPCSEYARDLWKGLLLSCFLLHPGGLLDPPGSRWILLAPIQTTKQHINSPEHFP